MVLQGTTRGKSCRQSSVPACTCTASLISSTAASIAWLHVAAGKQLLVDGMAASVTVNRQRLQALASQHGIELPDDTVSCQCHMQRVLSVT